MELELKMVVLSRLPEALGQHQVHVAHSLSPRPVSLTILLVLLGGEKQRAQHWPKGANLIFQVKS